MDITLTPSVLCGSVKAIGSKSHAHRLLICAALSDKSSFIKIETTSKDIEATASCLCGLGAEIERTNDGYKVSPISKADSSPAHICAGESGSTLRFLLPVIAALGRDAEITMKGRLAERPLSPLTEILKEGGITLSEKGSNPLTMTGKLIGSEFSIAANVSSQFISGLLFASPLLSEKTVIHLTTPPQSTGYIDMTIDSMRVFGITVTTDTKDGLLSYTVEGKYKTPDTELSAEGDWSNAAFWLCAGAIGTAPVAVSGLSADSLQPDRAIIDILKKMGAEVEVSDDKYCVSPSSLTGCTIDVKDCPDLVPAISLLGSFAMGKTQIVGGKRLKIKESDRIKSVCDMINSLGGEAEAEDDGLTVHGTGLCGGTVKSYNDHRIAMAAAVASGAVSEDVSIIGAEAVEKSYPHFFSDLKNITLNFENLTNG